MNLVTREIFGGKPSGRTYIGGVSATISTPALLATRLGISTSRISNFTIIGSDIQCRIIGSYNLQGFDFNGVPCTYYKDPDYLVTSLGYWAFYNTYNFNGYDVDFQNCLSIDTRGLSRVNANRFLLKNVTNVADFAFANSEVANVFYIPNCTSLGTSVLSNNVFVTNSGGSFTTNPVFYVHPSLATNNGGSPDGDIAYVLTKGGTVRYVTNFDIPNPVTTLASGTIYNTAIQLNFTAPTGSTNAIDYYECYANGVYKNNITASGGYITGLTPSTSYTVTLIAVDIFYNKSVVSNSVTQSTLVISWDITTGLVSYYKLDSNSNDNYGSNNGTDTSITYISGKVNNAGSYNGTTSKSIIGNPANLRLSTGTISCWVKTSGAGSSYRCVFGKINAYAMYLNNNVLVLYDWGGAAERSTGINLADNLWHHLVLVFDTGTNQDKVYVDGALILTTTMTEVNQTDNVCIGSNNSVQNFNGIIDEASIYNIKLTQTEIDLIYNSGNGITL